MAIIKESKKILKASWYYLARSFCRVFCRLFFRITVYGNENIPERGSFLLVSNHQSFLDPVFCGISSKRHLYFLARDSLFRNCFFRWLISSVNAIPVRQGQPRLSTMKKVISKLREGNGLLLFPEATRTSDGKITLFKPGFGLLCRRGNAIIVPVVIDGAFECWPRHKKIFRPGTKIVITYGKAISTQQVKKIDDRRLAATLIQTLRQMQTECSLKQNKKPYDYS